MSRQPGEDDDDPQPTPLPPATEEEIKKLTTDEAREADSAWVREEMARLQALDGGQAKVENVLARSGAANDGELQALLERVQRQAQQQEAERRALPCFRVMYPDGSWPDEGEHDLVKLVNGARACEDVQAFKDCTYRELPSMCPRHLASSVRVDTTYNLTRGETPERERGIILASLGGALDGGGKRVPLWDTDALRIVRALLRHQRQAMTFPERFDGPIELGGNMAEIIPGDDFKIEGDPVRVLGVQRRVCALHLTGSEKIAVLAGNTGRGKTLAGAYVIARLGGRYVTEYDFSRPKRAGGVELDTLVAHQGAVVVDQVGRANLGDSRFTLAQIEEVIDKRYAKNRLTLLIGNVTFEQFVARYDRIILERVFGDGVFVEFGGASLRPFLRTT